MLHLSHKSSYQTWRSDAPKCKASQEISAWTSNISDEHFLYCSSNVPRLLLFLKLLQNLQFARFWRCARYPAPARQYDIWTSKKHHISTPTTTLNLGDFDFQIFFAPQQWALFPNRNFQKCSEPAVFLESWRANVLRATTVQNFPFLTWPENSAPAL